MKHKLVCGRLLAGALVVALSATSIPATYVVQAEEVTYFKDGTYTGVGKGKKGDISLKVTLQDGKVTKVEEESQSETGWAWEMAKGLLDTIGFKQPTSDEIDGIDGVSGATISSNGIKAAVKDAFEQAKATKEVEPEEPSHTDEPGEPEKPSPSETPEEPAPESDEDDGTLSGEGTAENPYKISSVKQLQTFATSVDEGNNYKDQYVVLTADIDLSSVESFNSIGTEDGFDIFAGTFDGYGHTISNMTIKAENASDEGLFTAVKPNSVIKNLKVTNAYVEATPDFSLNIGIITGDLKKQAQISNCQVSGELKVKAEGKPVSAGGIVGNMMMKSEVSDCKADVNINAELSEGEKSAIGGIVGLTKMNAKVIKSEAKGTIVAKGDSTASVGGLGGILGGDMEGIADGSSAKVEIHTDGTINTVGEVAAEDNDDTSIFAAGKGTKEDPYQISDKEQLVAFAKSLNDDVLYTGKYVELTTDIDISDIENWEPIGGSQFAFNGTFDGKNHVINGLKEGTKDSPRKLSTKTEDFSNALGFFGTLGVDSVVKNVKLTDVAIYAYREDASFVGGLVGYMQGYQESGSYKGAVVDNCSVSGVIESTTHEKNAYVGGIAARQYKGAIINCHSKVNLKSTVEYGESIAACGGITGMTNRGLVANCYSSGDYFASMVRDIENEIEGMSSVGTLIGVNAGDIVNCYGSGDVTSEHYSIYTGAVTGWITGIGKAYQCYYDVDKSMSIAGRKEAEVQAYGTKTVGGVNEEGVAFEGGVADWLESYNASSYGKLVEKLNGNFETFGIDVSKYGLKNDCLRKWASIDGVVTLSDEFVNANYVQPEVEKVQVATIVMKDGNWYGRDNAGKVTVKIVVENNEIVSEEILAGSKDDTENYEKALERAKDKAVYGDTTGYGKGDTSKFAGGKGTKENPYLISTEAQLRYIAKAIGEDETWDNVYFKQTKDINLSDEEWLPIGFAIKAKIKGDPILYSAYPFRGHFDGAGYTITGLKIGSRSNPASMYTAAMFGFIGGDYETNLTYDDSVLKAELKNINLRDIFINNEVPYDTYTAGLVGTGQNGVFIDNCSVTGKISCKADDIASRGAGLAASMLRGLVTNCWTDVKISAITEEGDVYAGGMFSVTNRINAINCYTLGDVYGTANTNNKVHIGGFTGMAGAFQYNCFAMGSVTSNRPTVDIGIADGRIANIAYDRYCYANGDAKLIENGKTLVSVYAGADGTGSSKDVTFVKSASEMTSPEFVKLLNDNAKDVVKQLEIADEELGGIMSIYYTAGASGLKSWKLSNGAVVFAEKKTEEKKSDAKKQESSSGSTSASASSSSGSSSSSSNASSSSAATTDTTIPEIKNTTEVAISNTVVPLAGKTNTSVKKAASKSLLVDDVATEEAVETEEEGIQESSKVQDSSTVAEDTSDIADEEVPLNVEKTSESSVLPLVFLIIVAFLVVLGAGYYFYNSLNKKRR